MDGCNVVAILSMADMFGLECRNCGAHELGLYRVSYVKFCYGRYGLSFM